MRKPPQQTRRRQRRHQPRQRARAHFSENHALIFLAIVQPFYSSKPYHKSLHSCSLSLSRLVSRRHGRQASVCFVLIVFPRALSRSLLNQEKKQKKMKVRVVREALFFSESPPSSVKTVLSRLRRRGSLLLCITSDERVFAFMM